MPEFDTTCCVERARKSRQGVLRRGSRWLLGARHFQVKIALLTAASVAAIALLTVAITRTLGLQETQARKLAGQSQQVLEILPKAQQAVAAMDEEKRGYLLTAANERVEAYRRALADFYTYCGYGAMLLADSPPQAELLNAARTSVQQWINAVAAPEIAARRYNHALAPSPAWEENKDAIKSVQQRLTLLQSDERSIYQARLAAASREQMFRSASFFLLAIAAIGLVLLSGGYSFVLARRQRAKITGAEIRLRALVECIFDGMITVDQTGVICSINPAAEKMFSCQGKEMLGHKFSELVPRACYGEGVSPAPVDWQDLVRRTGSTTLAIGRSCRNTYFPIEISLSRMQVDHVVSYVAVVRDVTERKRFEQEIAAEKESLAVTLRSIGDGVITTDVQGKIIMINNAAESLTGWSSAEAVGQPLRTVFNVSIDLAAQARTQRNGHGGDANSLLLNLPDCTTLVPRDGAERSIEQVASPIRNKKNEVAGVVLVFRDITERERNANERRKAEALEQLGLLAGGIAHDFNNLLTAIIGNISLASLLLPVKTEMSVRLEDARNASLRARDLAQQLLTFARGGAPIKKTASIGKLIQDTVSFSLRGSHSRSELDVAADLWPAELDTGQISQVIANLIVNADQAMPNGGTIRVRCENFTYPRPSGEIIPDLSPGDYVRIAIRDEGVGIPEHYLKRIFDPYFTTKPKGNGLGLATTYSIIKNHKGLITVQSQTHMGSTFTIYLPAQARQQAAQHAVQPTEVPINGTGRILVVDDEEAIRELVEFTLSHLGYEVAGVGNALDGVTLYRDRLKAGKPFDLVILDLTLPGGMGGKEALKHLLEIDPKVKAIVSSGYATDATMSRYQEYGFRGVIAKPYEASELGRTVAEVIASSSSNNSLPSPSHATKPALV